MEKAEQQMLEYNVPTTPQPDEATEYGQPVIIQTCETT